MKSILAAVLVALTLLVGASETAFARDRSDDPRERCSFNKACTLIAEPVQGAISVDGRLDEADWQNASVASGFLQYEPNEGEAPSQQTEVRILYGASAVYVGAVLHDDAPDQIMKTLGRRDAFNQADWFIASIDSYFDRKTAYNFAVNAAGVQADGIISGRSGGFRGGGGFEFDTSWDAVWDSSVRVTATGWIVEMRIPYSMLRFSEGAVQQWGVNFRRIIPRFSETDDWVLVPRAERGGGTVARYGTLDGLKNIQPRRNFQVTPYTVSKVLTEEGDPGKLRSERNVDFGGDLKVGLSSNVTLDATINPDFGQVDADPAELNLTAFETRFREKRPFFTEGVQIYNFSLDRGGSLLYTRRIGGRAPIIGASKLSGRTSKGLSFGVLGASTGDNFDPSRYYGVARLKQQLGRLSSVGGILTAYQHNGERRSLVGGLDWDLRLKNNTFKFDGQTSFTRRAVPGSDDPATTGFSFIGGFDKIQGNTSLYSGLTVISDDFNPNDVGQLRRNNYVNLNAGLSHQINGGKPLGPFRRASMFVFTNQDFSYRDGLDLGFGTFAWTTWQTKGFQEIRLRVESDNLFGGYDIYETRGLGARTQPREYELSVSYETDSRRAFQLEPETELKFYGDGGHNYGLGLRTRWNVNSRLNLSVSAGYGGDAGVTAWASNEAFAPTDGGWAIGEDSGSPDSETAFRPFDDGGNLDALFGNVDPYDDEGRYYLPVFGERDTRTADLTLRGDVTFSPTLSIQFYGQVFTARGQYENFSVLEDRDTLTPVDAYPKRHDFAFTSFQTNTVLRWEYQPGSTLYLVWTQSRRGSADFDAFDLTGRSAFDQRSTDQLLDSFDPFPTNVFLIKLSYKFLR